VVTAHDDRSGVHHVQAFGQHAVKSQARIVARAWILDRVGRIDAIDLGALSSSCASISMARSAAAVSVVKKDCGAGGKDHHAVFSRWRTARRRM